MSLRLVESAGSGARQPTRWDFSMSLAVAAFILALLMAAATATAPICNVVPSTYAVRPAEINGN